MKMEPKVTTAMASLLPLLFLSTITAVERDTGVLSRSIPTQVASPIEASLPTCDNYDTMNVWFSKQMRLSNILAQNILQLDTLHNATCDFYEKDAMQLLFNNVEKINRLNGSQSEELPKLSGELGKDLDQILPWIKKLVPKGFKHHSCCKELEKSLTDIKEPLGSKWIDLKGEITGKIHKDKAKIKKELQEKQEKLKDQLGDTKKKLEKIQHDMKNIGSDIQTKCCEKFDIKIKNLQIQINKANDEAGEFGKKLEKIKDNLNSQDKEAKDASETLEKRGKNIKEMLDKPTEKQSKNMNCTEELEKRVEKLESHAKELADKINRPGSSTNLNVSICQANSERLAKIDAQLEKLLKDKKKQENKCSSGKEDSGNAGVESRVSGEVGSPDKALEDRINKLQQEVDKLRENLNKSENSCENTDQLNARGDKLMKSVENMNKTYDEHLKTSSSELEEIKRLLKNAQDKLRAIKTNNKSPNYSLQKLINLLLGLKKAKDAFKNVLSKVKESQNQLDKPSNSHNDILKEQLRTFNENWAKADQRVRFMENQITSKQAGANKDGVDRMGKLLESLHQDMNRSESEIERLEKPKEFHEANMEKLIKLENEVNPCQASCNELGKMNDLIDNIEDLENFFKISKPMTALGSKKKTPTKSPLKMTTKKKREPILIGGIDYVEQHKIWNGEIPN